MRQGINAAGNRRGREVTQQGNDAEVTRCLSPGHTQTNRNRNLNRNPQRPANHPTTPETSNGQPNSLPDPSSRNTGTRVP